MLNDLPLYVASVNASQGLIYLTGFKFFFATEKFDMLNEDEIFRMWRVKPIYKTFFFLVKNPLSW